MARTADSSAMKLELLEQRLDPRASDPERIKQEINAEVKRGTFTLKDIERFTTFKVPTLSQHLRGEYEGDVNRIDAALVRFYLNWIAKTSILQTEATKAIHNILAWAHKKRRIAIIVGDNGRGKTTSVQAYCAEHPDETAYIALDATSRLLEFFDALAKSLKIENQMSGPASFRREAIIRALQRRQDRPLMILIDECDEIKPRILSAIRTIWGDNDGRCAIVMIGTGKLETILQQHKDLRYIDTRISLRLRVPELEEHDAVKLINRFPHCLERAEMRDLVGWANKYSRTRGGIRALANLLMNSYDLMQAHEKDEIDADLIEEAKTLL